MVVNPGRQPKPLDIKKKFTEATHTSTSNEICQCFILILISVKIVLSEIKPAVFSGEELLTARNFIRSLCHV